MKKNSIIKLSALVVMLVAIIASCTKKYEEPPQSADPNLTVTTTIKALKAMHVNSGDYDVISGDIIIAGTVIANDKSGNLYKEMYIRDNTGAIAVELASNGLYANYPVGRKVYIKCKGLCLSDYHNMIQLGVKNISNGIITLEGIPQPLIPNYLIGGSLTGNDASPKVVTETDLALLPGAQAMQTPILGDLVQLNNYEFIIGDTKRSYGDTSNAKYALNGQTHIKACGSTSSLIIQTSGYADFAGKAPEAGNGSIAAIYTVYNTTKQLVLRDTTDVKFSGPRCFMFEDDFQSYTTSGTTCWSGIGWQNIKESGDVCFTMASFGSNIFPKVSAFTSTDLPTTNIKSWLISPPVTLAAGTTPKYSFTCARRYTIGTFKALISTNYAGGPNPAAATWIELGTVPANATNSAPFTPFDPFGPYDLTAYAGQKVYLAFTYEAPAGSAKSSVATFEPDDMKISKN